MKGNRIIVHTLIKVDDKYLVIKRSANESTYANFWDIPGGLAELGEIPRDAAIRETKEEVNLNIIPTKIIHEDSNLDLKKDMIFIRLVYLCELNDTLDNLKLDYNEHSEYKFINDIGELDNELVVPFLIDLFKNDLK
jgi:8-oxo-dGTP diphosphatase